MVSKQLLLFDLDGTLVNSAPDLAAAVNKMLVALQRSSFDEKLIEDWVGNGAAVLIKRALSGSSEIDPALGKALVEQALELFFEYYFKGLSVKTHLYEGVMETLATLKKAGFPMAVVTNKPERFVAPILNDLKIDSYFVLSVGGDSLPQKKPHPLPLLYACEQLGFQTDNCIMIGDSKNDILAAKAANIKSIGVSYGYNYGEDISLEEPDWVVDDFSKVLTVLGV